MCQKRERWYPKSKGKNKNIKLNGQGSWINLVHRCASTINTLTNHCPVTKTQPFNPLSINLLFGPLTFKSNIRLGSLQIESLQCYIYDISQQIISSRLL